MHKQTLFLAALASLASAHQNWHQFWVNDVSPGYQTCLRMPPTNNPVTDVTSNDITCNVNGNIVPTTVSTCGAKAGDTIKVQWDSSTHPGPITHFLYGPVADASKATGLGTWYKIDELDSQGGKWANEIMQAQNMTYSFKLPSNLASGDYLLRGEMEALHGSQTLNGAQFYIGCAQLSITGSSGSGTCAPGIQLPGAYKATDSDIYITNYYNGFNMATFTAPGGPVATCGAGGNGGSKPSTTTAKTTTASTKPAVTPTTTTTSIPPKVTTKPASSTRAPATTTTFATKTTSVAGSGSGSGSGGAAPAYGQCGGQGWNGATTCVSGYKCVVSSQYYSQCVTA